MLFYITKSSGVPASAGSGLRLIFSAGLKSPLKTPHDGALYLIEVMAYHCFMKFFGHALVMILNVLNVCPVPNLFAETAQPRLYRRL